MSHESKGESDEWYTPKYIFDSLGEVFTLDVAAPVGGPRYVPCAGFFDKNDDGLAMDWSGFVWMNPPFGHQSTKRLWLDKFFEHGNGIALMPDRTSAPWFHEFAPQSDAILFLSPKVKFERPDGSIGESPGNGTVLMASGYRGVNALKNGACLGILAEVQA